MDRDCLCLWHGRQAVGIATAGGVSELKGSEPFNIGLYK